MLLLVCYDVDTRDAEGQRRLRRIAEVCKDHGVRVQYSIFECRLAEREWVVLRQRLLEVCDVERDNLRIYYMCDADVRKTEHYGARKPLDVGGPLIV